MYPRGIFAAALVLLLAIPAHAAPGNSVDVNGFSAGPTPFISVLDLTIDPPDALKRIEFVVEPRPTSVTRPITASFSSSYLVDRGYLDTVTGHLSLPVFGLYADHDNTVALVVDFRQGPTQQISTTIPTAPWADPSGGIYLNPSVVQARTTSTALTYDYVMLKAFGLPISPVVVDTDGEVRWVGTAGVSTASTIFIDNAIYLSDGGSGIKRMELDGSVAPVASYAGLGVTYTGHHNFDPGKDGILIEVDTTSGVESTVMEISLTGEVLRTWKMADIISAAMIEGGDDPSGFVVPAQDWFHNNACTYQRHEDALIVSGREDFVIALDYETGAIKWILGDPTKKWHQYPSLTRYELALQGNSLPPIGQHALSIARDGGLLLFDNGRASLNKVPIGEDRSYSAPRKYRISSHRMIAQETWNYLPTPAIQSQYCSSVYEDGRNNYVMDYSLTGDVIGFDGSGAKAFHYNFAPAFFCGTSWNAIPVHLEGLVFP